jgi:large conductance mechanosensitive channel
MPLESERDALLESGRGAAHKVKGVWDDFTDWVFRDNVLEVALGLVIASAFTSVVNSFVSDLMLPIISLLPFIGSNLDDKFAVLRGGNHYGSGYDNAQQAKDDGATVLAYGAFIDRVINFFGIGFSLYMLGTIYTWMSKDAVIKHYVKCKYCRKDIKEGVSRCFNCTSWQDGREER